MKAALALIFFACVAGSMADSRLAAFDQLLQQGQGIVQTVIAQLQTTLIGLAQQALGQLTSVLGSFGSRFDLDQIFGQLAPLIQGLANQALGQLLGGLSGLLGGRASVNIAEIFESFIATLQPAVIGIGQHLLNQGLAAVLGGLGSLGGSRFLDDILSSLSSSFGQAVTVAQGALQGALSGLTALGSSLLDASKPHWEQLQEQLLGHGLNVLGSISETINNLHGSITGGR